jgi:hypothetical protein
MGATWHNAPASENENAGRATLEAVAGRALSDLEWERARARLLEFVLILRIWQKESPPGETELLKAA